MVMYENWKARALREALMVLTLLCLCPFVAGPGLAQEKPDCEEGLIAVGDMGITRLQGKIHVGKPDENGDIQIVLRFMSEPVIQELDPDGPAVGKLRVGDVIVAVDGKLITAEGAGHAFVDPPVGIPVELRIRRDGKEGKVEIVPDWICVDKESAVFPHWVNVYKRLIMGLAPKVREEAERQARERALDKLKDRESESRSPRPDVEPIPRPSKATSPDLAIGAPFPTPGLPHSWMGFGLECSIDGNWEGNDLRFTEPPRVFRVEPGSKAYEAGLKRHDVLTHIDGLAMDTQEGTKHFTEIKPGQRVEWKVQRDGESVKLVMVAEPIPRWAELIRPEKEIILNPIVDVLRYSGVLGKTAIEVRGSAPVNITVNEATGQVIIQTADTTVRLKKTD
jgi:hypothetical protein